MNTTTNQRDVQNKTAIITGSGRGIGKETAIQLAANVGNLVVCSRTEHCATEGALPSQTFAKLRDYGNVTIPLTPICQPQGPPRILRIKVEKAG